MRTWIVFIFTVTLLLVGCNNSNVYNQTQANVADVKLKVDNERHKSDALAKAPPSLVVKKGLYVDSTPISLERQPSWLKNRVIIRGDQLPFSYYSRTIVAGAGSHVLTRYQAGLDQATTVSVNYSGTVKGALDLVAAKTGYVYTVHGNNVYWQAFVTRTYDIAFMPGSSDYLMGGAPDSGGGNNGGGGGGGAGGVQTVSNSPWVNDASASEYSNQTAKLSIWKDLEATIKQMLSPEGKVMVSESTTTVTVRDRPTNVQLVGQYVHNLNSNLSKQVLVKVQVLEVILSNDYNFGINWALIANAFTGSKYLLNANYGTPISITPLSPQSALVQEIQGTTTPVVPLPEYGLRNTSAGVPGYTVLVSALQQQGKVAIVSEPRVVCLNNQVSVIKIIAQESYVASVQSSSIGGGTSLNTITSQITPGNLVTGLTLYILPKIMQGKVYLQVAADLSAKQSITTFTSGSSSVQLPSITAKHFNQRSLIHSGDTLILSGFRQVSNQAGAMQLFGSQALGGKGSIQRTGETVVLITPIVLHGYA